MHEKDTVPVFYAINLRMGLNDVNFQVGNSINDFDFAFKFTPRMTLAALFKIHMSRLYQSVRPGEAPAPMFGYDCKALGRG